MKIRVVKLLHMEEFYDSLDLQNSILDVKFKMVFFVKGARLDDHQLRPNTESC